MPKSTIEGHEGDAPAHPPSRGTAQSTLAIIRSLERASHDLENTLTVLRRDSEPPPREPKHASGIRGRVHSVLIVAEDDATRRLLVDRLRAAGFFVDWACDAESGRQKASQSAPDVVVVDRGTDASVGREFAKRMEADESPPPIAILAIDGSDEASGGERTVAVFQWRETGREIRDVVQAIMRKTAPP
jgi:CheY-like chemotaxis protein